MTRLLRIVSILALAALPLACGAAGSPRAFRADFLGADVRVEGTSPSTAISHSPQLCCDGGRVYAVWIDERGPSDQRVMFNRSTNGGASWNATPRRLDTDLFGFGASFMPRVCCYGQRIYVAWLDTRDGNPDVRFNRSLDGGLTWLGADVRVNINEAGTLTHSGLTMCCSGDSVFLAFVVEESATLLVDQSFGGSGAFTRVPVCPHSPGAAPAEPFLCCDAGEVYVAWTDFRDGMGDIYVNRSADGGVSWELDGVRIDRGVAGSADSRRPRLCCADRRVYAVWEDARSGRTVYFNRSSDGARTWRSIDLRMDLAPTVPTLVGGYDVCCERGLVHVTWTDNRSGGSDVFVRRSVNSGLDFGGETRLDDGPAGASASLRPRICCESRNVFVAWVEGSPENVWFSYSGNEGAAWIGTPLRMNTTLDGVAFSAQPALCCSGQNVYVAWSDGRVPPGRRIRLNASRP